MCVFPDMPTHTYKRGGAYLRQRACMSIYLRIYSQSSTLSSLKCFKKELSFQVGHLAALPSPSLAQACGRAGAGKRGSRLPGGVGRGGDGHGRACGCRVQRRAGVTPSSLIYPALFCSSVSAGAHCPLPWSRSPRRASGPPRRGPRELQQPALGVLPAGAPALPRPRTGPSAPGLCALVDRRLFPLDLTLGLSKAPFYFQCHFGVCLLFPATSRFQGYGRLPAGSGKS